MKMGTGKTKVALDLIRSRQEDIDCIIWIAPASLINEETYMSEIKKWTGKITKDFNFFTVEGISMSDTKFLMMRSLAEKTRNFCVVDESITVKNTDAGRTKRLLQMWDMFDFRLILNGTPLSKGLIDLYAQIQFISPKILNMTEIQFAHNFLQFKNDGYKPWKRWSKPENEHALIELIRPYIFDSDLYIDSKLVKADREFMLSNYEQYIYQDEKAEFLHGKFEVDFLAAAQKFQTIYSSCKAKNDFVKDLVSKTEEKFLIFVKFLNEVDILKEMFPDAIEYTGRHKDDLSEFAGNKRILICTYGTGSFGLNLQFCRNVIFYTQTFDYKDKEQSLHRVYRTGQERDVFVYNLWVKTGLDSLIKKSLYKKENTLSNVNKIISKKEAMEL